MSTLQVSQRVLPRGGLYVHLQGAIDRSTLGTLEEIFSALRKENCVRLVLDLSSVHDISTAGLEALLDLFSWVRSNQGKIVLLGASKSIREMLDLLGVEDLFAHAADIPTSLELLQASPEPKTL